MLSEHDAIVKWRNLFANGAKSNSRIRDKTIKDAHQLLRQLPQESPVRFRLATELEEIRELRRQNKCAQ